MSGKTYDENFIKIDKAEEDSADWYEIPCADFDVYGLADEKNCFPTRRMPLDEAKKVSDGVAYLSRYGAGGRILFSTDSSFIALKVEYGLGEVPTVCNYCFSYGFDLYKFNDNGQYEFVTAFRPVKGFDDHVLDVKSWTGNDGIMNSFVLNLPHFSEVKKLYIGLEKGSKKAKGKKYCNEKPVVFYGSSITHGAAAGRPGNSYENFISQKYNLDYVNLGFAGNAKGEETMAQYISELDMCAFVCDYDYNAPSAEHLEATHYNFYETVRKKHKDIPYIMVSAPTCFKNSAGREARRDIILKSYKKAVEAGDKNVYFIDGTTLFDGEFFGSCTSDGCHPNDLGFYRMADKIGSVIAKVLFGKEEE